MSESSDGGVTTQISGENSIEDKMEKRKIGRPVGTTRGRQKVVMIRISDENLAWLDRQSQTKTILIGRMIKNAIEEDKKQKWIKKNSPYRVLST